jgi:hypothetical protein
VACCPSIDEVVVPAYDEDDDDAPILTRLGRLAVTVAPEVEPMEFWARVAAYAFFVLWTFQFLRYPVASPELAASFMHLVNLPFHEAGHILLMPTGWSFLISLGGSLGQVAFPLLCMGALLVKNRDPFGASLGLWWVGQSFMDIAPYIGDARALQLMLLGGHTGQEVEGHDWEAILGYLGWLERDRMLARLSHVGGAFLMLAALAWGGYVLLLQHRNLASVGRT